MLDSCGSEMTFAWVGAYPLKKAVIVYSLGDRQFEASRNRLLPQEKSFCLTQQLSVESHRLVAGAAEVPVVGRALLFAVVDCECIFTSTSH